MVFESGWIKRNRRIAQYRYYEKYFILGAHSTDLETK